MKSYKKQIGLLLAAAVVLFSFVMTYVTVNLSMNKLYRESEALKEEIVKLKDKRVYYWARYQELASRDNVIPFAVSELGLEENNSPSKVIRIQKSKIYELEKYLSGK
ncbi:MAG: hypothetical protein HUU43_01695 [Ignavibacteriaceae bacterium]|nr:hypothetical protein [Ignavibacteriaceae bacterium]NUM69535.1 hypothetical protein [Ignavibacteriaceae bacterium]